MATITTITTTYAGEFAGEYIEAALLSGVTLGNNGITIKQNIKFKEIVKKLSTGANLIQNGVCDFTPTSTVDTVERILEPEEFSVNLKLCKKDFRSDWEAIEMGLSAHDNLPTKFSDFLIAHVLQQVSKQNENTIWQGLDATNGEFGGFVELMTADAGVIDVVGVSIGAGGITAANVVAELGKMVDQVPDEIYGNEGLMLYVSQNIMRAYIRSLGGFGASGLGAAGFDDKGNNQRFGIGNMFFDGVLLFVANGLDPNVMILAEKENLWFGTGLLNDTQEVKVLDQADIDGSQNVHIVVRYTASVQFGIAEECVLYTPIA